MIVTMSFLSVEIVHNEREMIAKPVKVFSTDVCGSPVRLECGAAVRRGTDPEWRSMLCARTSKRFIKRDMISVNRKDATSVSSPRIRDVLPGSHRNDLRGASRASVLYIQ